MSSPNTLFAKLRSDFPASVVVFFVALPLCLGIAMASGAPLISGVIAGIVGGIVVGALSGSPLGVSGPAAGLAVIVLGAIEELGSFEIFLVAVILAGLGQLVLGYAKAGVIAYYFPSSVITGMLAGIGIIIFLKQIPHALGYDHDHEGDLSFLQNDGQNTFSEMTEALGALSAGPMVIAAVSLAILLIWQTERFRKIRWLSVVPGPLVAVVSGVVLGVLFQGQPPFALEAEQFVSIPVAESLADLSGLFTFPDFSALGIAAVYKTALVMAVVASLETLLCVEATDKLDPDKHVTPTNRELKAQGVGNIISGFLGGLPVTQVIVRSSANIQSGGKTKLSAILHGVLLMVSVVALPAVMNMIPLATLAAILFVVGYKLAKPSLFRRMYLRGRSQFIPFILTIVGIVFTDLLVGVGIGLAVGVVGLLVEDFQLPFKVSKTQDGQTNVVRVVLAQQVTFLNKARILQALDHIEHGSRVEIDATDAVFIHADVVEIIEDFEASAPSRDLVVELIGLEEYREDPSLRAGHH